MDSLAALATFVRAAELRSFTAAGRHLQLSSSAVGKAITRLEERHGVRFFNRSTRSVALTHEGEMFLESCRRIFSEIQALEELFARGKDTPSGKLRVSLPLMSSAMAPLLGRFMKAYPAIELHADFGDRQIDLIEEGYDIAVRAGEVADSRLISRKVGSYKMALVASPEYLAREGSPRRPADLASHRCLHLKDPTGMVPKWSFSVEDARLMLPTALVANSTEALIALAEIGMGIASVPDFAVEKQMGEGTLAEILPGSLQYEGAIRVIWPSSRFLAPKLRAFVDFLGEHAFSAPTASISSRTSAKVSSARPAIQPPKLSLAS
jgi:DNA-binding transcriptional LysR family regulator